MIVAGSFRADAPYVSATCARPPQFTGGFIRFLIDTGAAATVLQHADFLRLAIPAAVLTPAPFSILGVGGTTTASLLRSAELTFTTTWGGYHILTTDIYVLPPLALGVTLPSVLGRDVINLAAFTCEFRSGRVLFDF